MPIVPEPLIMLDKMAIRAPMGAGEASMAAVVKAQKKKHCQR